MRIIRFLISIFHERRRNPTLNGSLQDNYRERMDRNTWIECTDSKLMIRYLRGNVSERKWRLFFVACAKTAWQYIEGTPDLRTGLHIAEQVAEGMASEQDRVAYFDMVFGFPRRFNQRTGLNWRLSHSQEEISAFYSVVLALSRLDDESTEVTRSIVWQEANVLTRQIEPELLREIVGDPFRSHTSLSHTHWLTTDNSALAEAIYQSRSFDKMKQLGEQIARSGCDDAEILHHLKSDRQHVLGCWVLDLLLGNK
jgi:hypothetical protein